MNEQMMEETGRTLEAEVPPRAVSALAISLARAKSEFPRIARTKTVKVKTKQGGLYEFSYAPLEAIVAAITPALSANGLSIIQDIDWQDKDHGFVTTTIIHASGQVVTTAPVPVILPPVRKDDHGNEIPPGPQEWGSALTYARRYSLVTALNLATDDDDDANLAQGNTILAARAREETPIPQHPMDPVVVDKILGCETMDQLATYWGSLPAAVRHPGHAAVKDQRKAELLTGER